MHRRWLGRHGLVYGMDGFGASGPHDELAQHFGFTTAALVDRIRRELG